MMRKMYDAAWPPASPPDVDAVGGYIGGNTPHVWTEEEWARQTARYRLPIFTRSYGGLVVSDAAFCIAWLQAHNVPKGTTLVLDFETRVDAAYLKAFDERVVAAGWKVMVYGSRFYVLQNPRPSGGYWTATWNNVPHLDAGASATQYGGDTTIGQPYDLSVVADSVSLWDTQGDWLDMATVEDVENAIRKVLNEGTGKGQVNWAGTSKATLATVQATHNEANAANAKADGIVAKLDALSVSGLDLDALANKVADVLAGRLAA